MQIKPLLELIKRVQKSKFTSLIMHNRMIIQCYDVTKDSDSGMHYILHIPDTEEYSDKFYDQSLIIHPESIMNTYKDGHDILLSIKKENKIPLRDVSEFVDVVYNDDMVELVFQHVIENKLVASNTVGCRHTKDDSDDIKLVTTTLDQIYQRVKRNGLSAIVDAYKAGYYYKIMNHSQIIYGKIDLGNIKVRIPLFKSMLAGIKMPDKFVISVQETILKDIYIYTIQLTNKGITDQYISYIINF